MLTMTPIVGSLQVVEAGRSPDGEHYVVVPCIDFDTYKQLPGGAAFGGRAYGLTGWNSDQGLAYYKAGRAFAVSAGH